MHDNSVTFEQDFIRKFALQFEKSTLENLYTVAFTHKYLPLEVVGKFHLAEERKETTLRSLKASMGLSELMYVSTCNRVEFILVNEGESKADVTSLVKFFADALSAEEQIQAAAHAEVYQGNAAVEHIFKVCSSLDSMVIGEREIITQMRTAHEQARNMNLSGDLLRLVMRKAIETAKQIFTETDIFKKPVSVVSLAFHRLRALNVPLSGRVVMVGAGKTNKAMARFLAKHGYKNIHIFNRTVAKAEMIAAEVGGTGLSLDEIDHFAGGFDVLISCTGAEEAVVSKARFVKLLGEDKGRKVLIDLALPGDFDPAIFDDSPIHVDHINIEELRLTAERNMAERSREISRCEEIIDNNMHEFHEMYHTRQIELAMRQIPASVKEIRQRAIDQVYAKELESLNPESREVLNKIMDYMEKKYISVPMKMAREVMLNGKK